jgi:glutaconate CoA-transferase subunit B
MADHTQEELFAILLARDLRPEDRSVQIGANMPMARAAAVMAGITRLPDLRVLVGLGVTALGEGGAAPPVYPFLFDPRSQVGEALMVQEKAFDYARRPDVFFVGGLQVDRRGNINLFGIPDGEGGWKLRGPGTSAPRPRACAGRTGTGARRAGRPRRPGSGCRGRRRSACPDAW